MAGHDSNKAAGTMVAVSPQEQQIALFKQFLADVPEIDEGGYENILNNLMNAGSIYDLDAPWKADSLANYKDRAINITGVRQAPSDFQDGFGVYLVVDLIDLETGEHASVTTGAVSIVAQLARAATLDAFPLMVIPRVASKPTKKGFYPQHLEIVKEQPPKRIEPEDPNLNADLTGQAF